jgi:hypothetical protein
VRGRTVTDPLTLAPGASVTPVLGVHQTPNKAMCEAGKSPADWPPHPGAREISVGPSGNAALQAPEVELAPIQ